jgi:hypothetical protein
MTDHHLRSIALAYPYFRLPSEYWPSSVRIAVYQSGGRLLKKRKAWWFRRTLSSFDIGSLQATGRRPSPRPKPPIDDLHEDERKQVQGGKQMNIDEIIFIHPELNMPPASRKTPPHPKSD